MITTAEGFSNPDGIKKPERGHGKTKELKKAGKKR